MRKGPNSRLWLPITGHLLEAPYARSPSQLVHSHKVQLWVHLLPFSSSLGNWCLSQQRESIRQPAWCGVTWQQWITGRGFGSPQEIHVWPIWSSHNVCFPHLLLSLALRTAQGQLLIQNSSKSMMVRFILHYLPVRWWGLAAHSFSGCLTSCIAAQLTCPPGQHRECHADIAWWRESVGT